MNIEIFFVLLHFIVILITILRVIDRPHREPAARIAWVSIIAIFPFIGVLIYLFFGEVNIGRKYTAKILHVLSNMPPVAAPLPKDSENYKATFPAHFEHLFKLGESISGFTPVGGNTAELMGSSDIMIDTLVADIDAAQHHVHLLFYIWLPDGNGCKIVEALKRAVSRGITCRAMADSMGSKTMIQSAHWQAMKNCDVKLAVVLPIGNPVLRALTGRIDLRNHRKIVIIDGSITYCGSQNCADAAFLVKHQFAPWVDAVLRLEGPIARQNQHLFVSDWMTYTNEDIHALLREPIPTPYPGFTAQVIGTGPTNRHMAMSQMFVALIASARQQLTITTPYYVPNEAIQSALQAAAYRGVKTTLIFPAKNDSWVVQGASRSYYQELLEAGVDIYEYTQGLLHTKSLTIDGKFTLMGSANLDRRSFDLNYENNMLIADEKIAAAVMARQQQYMAQSQKITLNTVAAWTLPRRLWNNTVAMLGPIL